MQINQLGERLANLKDEYRQMKTQFEQQIKFLEVNLFHFFNRLLKKGFTNASRKFILWSKLTYTFFYINRFLTQNWGYEKFFKRL